MELVISSLQFFALIFILLMSCCTFSDCYDPLDPNGKIAVVFDIHEWTNDGYVARVTINNYYQYRYIDSPGWNLGWEWTNKEIIWSMSGAFATVQGVCAHFMYQKPHSCQPNPVIADLMPDALPANRSEDCCRGGVLAASAIDPSNSYSSFEMKVGNLNIIPTVSPPANLTLLAPGPGYTCSPVLETEPTVSSDIGGRRKVQVYKSWKTTCTYSSLLANKKPICCVSLSTFYNPTVTTCPECSCGCKETGQNSVPCVSGRDILKCTDHMCPVRVHWHVKSNYITHWRVKLTVSNYNYHRNYSNWNVLVQHPGFSQQSTAYSFNSTMLPTVGFTDKVALFWGLQYYNNELLQANEEQPGSATTEILLEKDLEAFTLSNGWAFPRRMYFGGEECQMPLPDTFPMLPNGSLNVNRSHCLVLLLLIFFSSEIL